MNAPEGMTEYLRARDLRALGFTRTDAERILRLCGREVRFGRSVYVLREDVERVLLAAQAIVRTR